jgi:hypothetical protein
MKTTSVDNISGRLQWKTPSVRENLSGKDLSERQPQWKTTLLCFVLAQTSQLQINIGTDQPQIVPFICSFWKSELGL